MATGNLSPLYVEGISRHIYTSLADYDSPIPQIAHVGNTDMRYVLHYLWEGYRLPQQRWPGTAIAQGQIQPSFNKAYIIRNYGLGDTIPQEDIDDDIYGVLYKMLALKGGMMARAFKNQFEYDYANFFAVSGFASGSSVAGMADGKSLFNTAHPRSVSQSGITDSNRPAVDGDLSITYAQMMITAIETQTYPDGLTPMNNRLRVVVGNPALQFVADQVFNGVWERGTADRNTNEKLRSKNVKFIPWFYFQKSGATGTNNAYFGVGEEHYLHFIIRQMAKTRSDYDINTNSQIFTTTCRYDNGASDWRGTYASVGA